MLQICKNVHAQRNLKKGVAQTLEFAQHKCVLFCNNYMDVYTKCIISIVTTNVYSITFHPHVCCLTVHNHCSQEQTGAAFYTVCLALQMPWKAQKQWAWHRSAVPAGFSLLPLKCTIKCPLMSVTQCWRNKTAIRERKDPGQDCSVQPSLVQTAHHIPLFL